MPVSAASKLEQMGPLQPCQWAFQKLLAILICYQKQMLRPSTTMQLLKEKKQKEERSREATVAFLWSFLVLGVLQPRFWDLKAGP